MLDGTLISQDEEPTKAKYDKIPLIKPAFDKKWYYNSSKCIR